MSLRLHPDDGVKEYIDQVMFNFSQQYTRLDKICRIFFFTAQTYAIILLGVSIERGVVALHEHPESNSPGRQKAWQDMIQFIAISIAFAMFSFTAVFMENQWDLIAFMGIFLYALIEMSVELISKSALKDPVDLATLCVSCAFSVALLVLSILVFKSLGRNSRRCFYAVGSHQEHRKCYQDWLRFRTLIKIDLMYSVIVFAAGWFVVWTIDYVKYTAIGIFVAVLFFYWMGNWIVRHERLVLAFIWIFIALAQPAYVASLPFRNVTHWKNTNTLQAAAFVLVRSLVIITFGVCVRNFGKGFPERAFQPGKPDGPPLRSDNFLSGIPTPSSMTSTGLPLRSGSQTPQEDDYHRMHEQQRSRTASMT